MFELVNDIYTFVNSARHLVIVLLEIGLDFWAGIVQTGVCG